MKGSHGYPVSLFLCGRVPSSGTLVRRSYIDAHDAISTLASLFSVQACHPFPSLILHANIPLLVPYPRIDGPDTGVQCMNLVTILALY